MHWLAHSNGDGVGGRVSGEVIWDRVGYWIGDRYRKVCFKEMEIAGMLLLVIDMPNLRMDMEMEVWL